MSDFLASAWPIGATILVILGIAVLALLVVILFRVSKTMKSVQNMAEEADKEITPVMKKVDPLVDKAELTVDTLNLEMLRVDAILEDVEHISSVAGKTANTVDTVTSAPADAVTSIVDHLRGALGSKRKEQIKQGRVVYPIGAGKPEAAAEKPAAENASTPEAVDLAAKVASKNSEAPSATDTAAQAQDAMPAGKHSVQASANDSADKAAV